MEKRQGKFISLRIKLLVVFTLLFTVVFAAAYYWFYTFATDHAIAQIGAELKEALVGTAERIDGDELIALYQEGQPRADGFSDDPRYWHQIEWFDTVHKVEPRAWLYTYLKGDKPNEMIFITDLSSRYDTSQAAKFRESYIADDAGPPYAGLITTTLDLNPYTDKYGSWISGYTPVKNSKGEVVAGLGIDFQAGYVDQVQRDILNSMLAAFAITYVTLFILVYLISRASTRPIVKLTEAAERIGEGDYDQDLSFLAKVRFPDEINTLAGVFHIMVDKVRQREQKLKQEVMELRIEVDEAKRQKQVSEIVDTDFFQDLQIKANMYRRRNDKRQEEQAPDNNTPPGQDQAQPTPTETQPVGGDKAPSE